MTEKMGVIEPDEFRNGYGFCATCGATVNIREPHTLVDCFKGLQAEVRALKRRLERVDEIRNEDGY